jgi:hypothetical protein
VLVGADQQELGAPRVGRRRVDQCQRDAAAARLPGQPADAGLVLAGPTRLNPVPSWSNRDEPSGSQWCGSRAPGSLAGVYWLTSAEAADGRLPGWMTGEPA